MTTGIFPSGRAPSGNGIWVNGDQTKWQPIGGSHLVTEDRIRAALSQINSYISKTALRPTPELNRLDRQVYLKMENEQLGGSFKVRGALWRMLNLSSEQRRTGVIASTAGNHGVGLSRAGKILGIPVEIYLPSSADPLKLQMIQENGAKLKYFSSVEEAREAAKSDAQRTGQEFVSAYNDPYMMEGGGTVGIEINEELPPSDRADTIVIPLGGGGFASGVALAIRSRNPEAKVLLVQALNSPKMTRWLQAGEEVSVNLLPSIAEGLTVDMESGTIGFPYLQRLSSGSILLTEEEIADAMLWAKENLGIKIEASGASSIAAIQKLNEIPSLGNVIGIITGQNVSDERFDEITARRIKNEGRNNKQNSN
jgi:threonine dehydratase